jgi:hypothetical protein
VSSINSSLNAETGAPPAELSPEQINVHFIEIEEMLSRVGSATTYYQVLGVGRSAGQQEIKTAFHRVVDVLYMQYAISKNMPGEMVGRIDRAFHRASQAFATLASFARRREYDSALAFIATKPQTTDGAQKHNGARPNPAPVQTTANLSAPPDELRIDRRARSAQVYIETGGSQPRDNRRRCPRMKLTIPARVTGYDQQLGKWSEMTETVDVSRTGVKLQLRRKVKHGMVLHVTLPLPTKLRSHGFADQSYSVYTFVRRIEPPKQGVRSVGLEFVGENPPPGYLEKPWSVFRVKRWGGSERRRPNRVEHAEPVRLEYLDEGMQCLSTERANTENISQYGVRIISQAAPADFDFVRVSSDRMRFEALAALRSRFVGKDGRERLCLQLIDKEWPGQAV